MRERDKVALQETGHLQERIVELENQVADLKKALEAQSIQVDSSNTASETLSSTVEQQQVDISDLYADLAALQTVQNNQGTTLADTVADVAQLQVSDSTQAGLVEDIYATLSTLPTVHGQEWLYDASGVRRYAVLHHNAQSAVVLLPNGKYFLYNIGAQGKTEAMPVVNAIYFTLQNCQGTPWSTSANRTLMHHSTFFNYAIFAPGVGNPQSVTYQSLAIGLSCTNEAVPMIKNDLFPITATAPASWYDFPLPVTIGW